MTYEYSEIDIGDSFSITHLSCIDSTSTFLKDLAALGADSWNVVIADSQSSGRGRSGKSFYSGHGGLYMSVLLRSCDITSIETVTPTVAVAVSQSIERFSGNVAEIKWVNDIIQNGKKVCGILTESGVDSRGELYVIVGIGVNIKEPDEGYPYEISKIAGAILNDYTDNIRDELCFDILNNLRALLKAEGEQVFSEYRKRLCVIGKKVSVITPINVYEATVLDLCDDYRLKVVDKEGTEHTLFSGEISIKRK